MWSLVAYVVYRLARGRDCLTVDEVMTKIFYDIWVEEGLAICDSPQELMEILRYLEKLGIIKLEDNTIRIIDHNRLERIAKIVENSPMRTQSKLYDELIRRIENATPITGQI